VPTQACLAFTGDTEIVPRDEPKDIEAVLAILRQTLKRHFDTTGRYQRDVHVKGHGCARGDFQVRANLPPHLSQGLFAQAGSYSALARFSNSAPFIQPDIVPDGRGLAIRVVDVPGERLQPETTPARSQDFILVNHPTFLARDVKDYLRLEETRLAANYHPVRTVTDLVYHNWNPFRWRWRELAAVAQVAAELPSHPASYTYYSMVPFRFGQYIAKYRVLPHRGQLASPITAASFVCRTDAMGHLLRETLKRQALAFEFQVQLRTSEQSMPIEDATIQWPERESPYRTVADLILPRQEITALDCETRSFDVWNGIVDHRPLGGINRLRRLAYPLSAAARQTQTVA
jgi:catalase